MCINWGAVRLIIVTLIFPLLAATNSVRAQGQQIARIDSLQGEVEVKRVGEPAFKAATQGMALYDQDFIHTGRNSRAGVIFTDGVLLRLAQNTTLQLRPSNSKNNTQPLKMDEGKGFFFSRKPKSFPVIDSPAVSTAIRGTEFVIEVASGKTVVSILDGVVESSNEHGTVTASSGETVSTQRGAAPVKSILVQPLDAVQWALYYPLLISEEGMGPKAREALKEGKESALRSLEAKRGELSANDLTVLANLYLSVGEVGPAQAILARLTGSGSQTEPGVLSRALAARAIIEAAKNKKEEALNTAKSAESSHGTAESALALAYVAQAHFDLEGARSYLELAVSRAPKNSFLLARLAEIELAFGDVKSASAHVNEALAIHPEDVYALTVKGFLHLIREETDEAREVFERAISLDSSLAAARLGHGLAEIRDGRLAEGRRDIETAAYLAPNVAVYRSYLGKAYFEEERNELATHEYERAISLDPLDPTPYLYRAYQSVSDNRPVEALADVEKSIALNESRAVYRSSLALDQDSAVRSAGLSEVFNSLGFSQVARVEAIKSLNYDYSNYSAHRLLSDSYRTIQLNDAAISERKIADLLSPVSFNLFRSPSGEVSLNEYSALFERNESRTEIGFDGDTQESQVGPSIYNVGKRDKFGYLLGYEFLSTDGTRHNNYSYRHRARASAQYQMTYEDRFSFEAATIFRDRHDENQAVEDTSFEDTNFDLGYVRRITPNSKLVTQVTYTNDRNKYLDSNAIRLIELEELSGGELSSIIEEALYDERDREKINAWRGTAQYIYSSDLFSSVLGTQLYYSTVDREETSRIIDDEFHFLPDINYYLRSRGDNDLNSLDAYLYNTIHLTSWADLIVGATFSEIELEARELSPFVQDTSPRSRFNPKAGLTLYPWSTTTVRGAYFETLRKSSLEDTAALEPTLVGGINQRFTDLSGARARNYGLGIDQKILAFGYAGIEALHRDVIEDYRFGTTTVSLDFDDFSQDVSTTLTDEFDDHQDQDFLRSYYYHIFSKRWVGALDYEYSMLERTDIDLAQELEVQKIGSAARYFHPSGWFSFATLTWREQDRQNSDFYEDGNSDFWIMDLGLGYRLRNRHGSVVARLNNVLDQDFTYDQSLGFEEFVFPGFGASIAASINF